MKRISKIVHILLIAALLCLSPAFARAEDSLTCTVSVTGTLNFGAFSVLGPYPEPEIDMSILCNRNPSYQTTVYISLGNYSLGSQMDRNVKRENPASENYIEYFLYDQNGHFYSNLGSPGIVPAGLCFKNGECKMKIRGYIWRRPPYDFYAGQYVDSNLIVYVHYWSEY